jgi:uncharacterized membrane protein
MADETTATITTDTHEVQTIEVPGLEPETVSTLLTLFARMSRAIAGRMALETARAMRTQDIERQQLEDGRSIKRNRNRMYTLFAALLCSLVLTFVLYYPAYVGIDKATSVTLSKFAPFSFALTIAFDSIFTVWAYIHRY